MIMNAGFNNNIVILSKFIVQDKRPSVVTDEKDLRKAEKWRNQVIREIAKKVTQIQNGNR